MSSGQISSTEMLKRVARFGELKPSSRPFVDSLIPGHERQNFRIIGRGVTEDPSAQPAISGFHDFNLGLNKAAPGKKAALHSHTTVEVFMPLTGEWSITWGDDGENEVILGPWDAISVPPGVMRGFQNVGGEDAYLLAILGGSDAGKVTWPEEILEQAKKTGLHLDEKGNLAQGTTTAS